MADDTLRIDAEWIALNAFRGVTKIASKGDLSKSSYDSAMDLGGALYPELLGQGTSLLRRHRESDTAREYRQRAKILSMEEKTDAVALIQNDVKELRRLLLIAKKNDSNRAEVDQLKKRLDKLIEAESEINPPAHTENQLIFRDAYNIERALPCLKTGQAHRDFQLPDDSVLRVRVLHPDKPEHISGADIIYERHSPSEEKASIVAVQYKIWNEKVLYLSDPRMRAQLSRLAKFVCENQICDQRVCNTPYRFPCCSAFLRPTDKLQGPDQRFVSTGEHLPICLIDACATTSEGGASVLQFDRIRDTSLNAEMFGYLFDLGKIGSRMLTYLELSKFYSEYMIASSEDNVVIHAQEFIQ